MTEPRTALITGASRGLGLELARALAARGWRLVIDARGAGALDAAQGELGVRTEVIAIAGDITDEYHRQALVEAAGRSLELLVNNASELGPSPLPALAAYPPAELEAVYRANVLAPLRLIQLALPRMPAGARILNLTSDAAVEGYEGWGGYGSSKAALDQLTRVLGAERPELRVYAIDPGDMRTQMHQDAFPGEDISDRPEARESVPALLELVEGERPSGRYRAADLAMAAA
jgi:NAD(P)-dependent dehydrogenase (short-subunit alcohol dehydrogenase family)